MLTAQDAAKHLLKLKKAEESFGGFVRLHNPTWKLPDFHDARSFGYGDNRNGIDALFYD